MRYIASLGIALFLHIIAFGRAECLPGDFEQTDDKSIARAINKLAYKNLANGTGKNSSIRNCLKLAIRIARSTSYQGGLIKGYDLLGWAYMEDGKMDSARMAYQKGLFVADSMQHAKGRAFILASLGNLEADLGEVKAAVNHYLMARKIWEYLDREDKMLMLDIDIGCLYIDLEDYEKALDLFKKILVEAERQEDFENMDLALVNLGVIHEELQNYHKAKYYYEQLLERGDSVRFYIRKQVELSASSVYLRLGENELAEKYFSKALLNSQTDIKSQIELFIIWGEGFAYLGNYNEALNRYNVAAGLASSIEYSRSLSTIYERMSDIYKKTEEYKIAWEYYEKHQKLKKELRDLGNQKNLDNVIAKYQQREKELQIQNLQNVAKTNRIIQVFSMVLVLFLVITLIVIYSRYQLKQITSEKLTAKNETLEYQNRQIKARESQLRINKAEIEEKNKLLADHTDKIAEQNKALQRYNNDLEQFTYTVSHDLKSPIRTLHSFMQIIEKKMAEGAPIDEFVELAKENSAQLGELVNDLLAYTKIGRSKMHPEPVDLNQILQQVKRSLDLQIKESRAHLHIDPLPTVEGLHADLYTLFQNLIQNAIKFTAPGKTPYVQVRHEELEETHKIIISDNGIGIDQEDQAYIFDAFSRVSPRYEGTGIGLALVKKVIDYSNADIELSSTKGEGSHFAIYWPKS
ncbi:MAG: ATP-binding protein [Bacteroidota bacterium]